MTVFLRGADTNLHGDLVIVEEVEVPVEENIQEEMTAEILLVGPAGQMTKGEVDLQNKINPDLIKVKV